MAPWTKQFVREFIKHYKAHECLWRVKSKSYYDRQVRQHAYHDLLVLVKQYIPKATLDFVISKIKGLRTNFRKENMKMVQSIRQGARGDQVYQPRAWYYDQLEFLADQEENVMMLRPQYQQRKSRLQTSTSAGGLVEVDEHEPNVSAEESTYDDEQFSVNIVNVFSEASTLEEVDPDPSPGEAVQSQEYVEIDLNTLSSSQIHVPGSSKPRKKSPVAERYQPQSPRRGHNRDRRPGKKSTGQTEGSSEPLSEEDEGEGGDLLELDEGYQEHLDSHALFGQYVAKCLGEMSVEQNTHAQKLMFDVIYEGKLGTLSRQTHLLHGT
ncbi:hypothetical protein ElyMa_006140500 [Elysia marginata]|uniref:MADF domain-containing protein n=1 Tax=Elysia marginata TaxID=1093978 RepID=A0AAV4GYH7_9GAST|nr:hypothetical protein ElyMa_006140500 [Elysia marginata]